MKRARKAATPADPLTLLGRDATPAQHKLHIVRAPHRLHSDAVLFVRAALALPRVELAPREPGLYLEFPVLDAASESCMAALLGPDATPERVHSALHGVRSLSDVCDCV